jgi:hypothetical protein
MYAYRYTKIYNIELAPEPIYICYDTNVVSLLEQIFGAHIP